MSVMFEVYYQRPIDSDREARFSVSVAKYGGKITSHEGDVGVLTFEFSFWDAARQAAVELRSELRSGEHIDGPTATTSSAASCTPPTEGNTADARVAASISRVQVGGTGRTFPPCYGLKMDAEVVSDAGRYFAVVTDDEDVRRRIARADVVVTKDGVSGEVVDDVLSPRGEIRVRSNTKDFYMAPSRLRSVSAAPHLRFGDDEQRRRFVAKLGERGRLGPAGKSQHSEGLALPLVLRSVEGAIWGERGDATVSDLVDLPFRKFMLVTDALMAVKTSALAIDEWIRAAPQHDDSGEDQTARKDAGEDADGSSHGRDARQIEAVRDLLAHSAGFRPVPGNPEWKRYVRANGRRFEPTLAEATLWSVADLIRSLPDPDGRVTARLSDLVRGLDLEGARLAFPLLLAFRQGHAAVDHWLSGRRHRSGPRRIVPAR